VAPRSGDLPGATVLSNHHITDDASHWQPQKDAAICNLVSNVHSAITAAPSIHNSIAMRVSITLDLSIAPIIDKMPNSCIALRSLYRDVPEAGISIHMCDCEYC
jgi:hypothetical protein